MSVEETAPLRRHFSSEWPAASRGEEPVWGMVSSYVEPCATCGKPTRWVDRAYGDRFRFCSEGCLDERLDLEMRLAGPWPR